MPKPDLKDLVVLLISDWSSLGKELNIPREKLLLIESNFHHDPQTCKRKLFQCWLESTSEASYHQLLFALKNIGDDSLAEELCKKYGKRPLINNYNIGQTYTSRTFSLSNQNQQGMKFSLTIHHQVWQFQNSKVRTILYIRLQSMR